jgi:hypothetical protein
VVEIRCTCGLIVVSALLAACSPDDTDARLGPFPSIIVDVDSALTFFD